MCNYDVVSGCINATATTTGLQVKAIPNDKPFCKGIKLSKTQMRSIRITASEQIAKWNYVIG